MWTHILKIDLDIDQLELADHASAATADRRVPFYLLQIAVTAAAPDGLQRSHIKLEE